MGQYILDFYCIKAKLAVEVDGYFHGTEEGFARDVIRDAWLKGQGVEVYRIPAADIFADADGAADGVIVKALTLLDASAPPPPRQQAGAVPLPTSGEE